MNFRIVFFAVLAIFMLSSVLAAGEAIYSWTDKNGVRHMTNIPPVQPNTEVDII